MTILEKFAKKGINIKGSSFVQTNSYQREIEKINEMEREWKLGADRIGHMELNEEDNPKLIELNNQIQNDQKKLNKIESAVTEDIQRVDKDMSVVTAQQNRLRKEKEMRELENNSGKII